MPDRITLPPGITEEDFALRLEAFLGRKANSDLRAILRKDPKYQELVGAHRQVIAQMRPLQGEKAFLWAQIEAIREKHRKHLFKLLKKEREERKEVANAKK